MLPELNIIAAQGEESGFMAKAQDLFTTLQQGFDSIQPVGGYLLAIVVFWLGQKICQGIRKMVSKGLERTEVDDKIARSVGYRGAAEGAIASFVYYILLLFLAILALNIARLNAVSEPLALMLNQFLAFIPKLIGAAVLLYFVMLIAKAVKNIVSGLLQASKLDEKLGAAEGKTPVANALTTALYCFIVLLFVPQVLAVLGLESVSQPVGDVVASILSAVPNIIIACVLIAIGILIGQIARRLVSNLLEAVGADRWPSKLGLDIPQSGSKSLSQVVGTVVLLSVTVLMVGSAISALELELLAGASEGFVSGYFNILMAVIILGVGILLARLAHRNLADKNITLAKLSKGAILIVTTVIALQRSNIAPELTGLPYTVAIYAAGVAIGIGGAIALGMGGKDYVAGWLAKKG